jgi:hypothetical protein
MEWVFFLTVLSEYGPVYWTKLSVGAAINMSWFADLIMLFPLIVIRSEIHESHVSYLE